MTSEQAIQKAALAYLPATYRNALNMLGETPIDACNLAHRLGMTLGSCYKLLGVLRELKVICVHQHVRLSAKGECIKVWGLGTKDAAPPPKKTPAERSATYRAKRKPVRLGMLGI